MRSRQINLFDYKNNNDKYKSLNLVRMHKANNGRHVLITTSLIVAKIFHKQHKFVLRKIRKIINIYANNMSIPDNLKPKYYKGIYYDAQHQKRNMCYMNFRGFINLVSGLTGKKAMLCINAFTTEFIRMKYQLDSIHQQGLIPKSEANQRIIQIEQRDYKQLMECKSTFQKYENQDCHSIYYIAKYDYRKPTKWLYNKLIKYGVICRHRAFMRPCLNCDYMNEHYGKYGIHVTNKIVNACALNGGKSSNYRGRLFTYYCYYISEGKDKYSAIKKYRLYTNMGFTVAGRELIHKILAIHNVYPVSTHPKLPSIDVDLITKKSPELLTKHTLKRAIHKSNTAKLLNHRAQCYAIRTNYHSDNASDYKVHYFHALLSMLYAYWNTNIPKNDLMNTYNMTYTDFELKNNDIVVNYYNKLANDNKKRFPYMSRSSRKEIA